jgi:hypothetical protein
MIARAATLILCFVVVLSCQPAPQGFLEIAGWSPQGEPSSHGPDGLWEMINGAADTFLDYGFVELTAQQYSNGSVTVTVNAYDMGTPLNAYGVYRVEAPEGDLVVDAGSEAVVSPPYQCLLLKDRTYVKVEAYEGDIDEATGRELVVEIASALPGSVEPPPEMAALPAEGMIAGSARYTRRGLFALAELDEAVHASYVDDDGTEYRAFVLLPESAGSDEALWDALAERWQVLEEGGRTVLYREVPYEGFVGVARGSVGVVGVAGCETREELVERLARVVTE